MGFEAGWLAARRPYDEAALDPHAVTAIRAWGDAFPAEYQPVVVDLGSGTGAALDRARRWLAPHPIRAYAVDHDAALLTHNGSASRQSGYGASQVELDVVPLVGDLLAPLDSLGGPPDGSVDLVLGHALADLLPLDQLAGRVAALARPGGLIHLALVYDGLTAFTLADGTTSPDVDASLDAAVLASFHRHMDRPSLASPTYGGSTAGRRLGPVLVTAGLEVLVDAPSVWNVRADDGPGGSTLLARLIRFVVEAVREVGDVLPDDLEVWVTARQASLASRTLGARVAHRDLLARRPI